MKAVYDITHLAALAQAVTDPEETLRSLHEEVSEAKERIQALEGAIEFVTGLLTPKAPLATLAKLFETRQAQAVSGPDTRAIPSARDQETTEGPLTRNAPQTPEHSLEVVPRKARVLGWLRANRDQARTVREVADSLGFSNARSLRVLMDDLVKAGELLKVPTGPHAVAYQVVRPWVDSTDPNVRSD
jgi:hypothetical protein